MKKRKNILKNIIRKKIYYQSPRDMWDNIKRPNMQITGILEVVEKIRENYLKNDSQKLTNMSNSRNLQIQDAQQTQNRINKRKPCPGTS